VDEVTKQILLQYGLPGVMAAAFIAALKAQLLCWGSQLRDEKDRCAKERADFEEERLRERDDADRERTRERERCERELAMLDRERSRERRDLTERIDDLVKECEGWRDMTFQLYQHTAKAATILEDVVKG
jgi:hypothetical protein